MGITAHKEVELMLYKYFQYCWFLYPTPHLIRDKDKTPQRLFPKCCFKDECHTIRADLQVFNFASFCEALVHVYGGMFTKNGFGDDSCMWGLSKAGGTS